LLTELHGKKLIQWANSGEGYTPPMRKINAEKAEEETAKDDLAGAIKAIDNLATQLASNGIDKKVIGDTIKANFEVKGKPSANYNAIKDIDTATKVYKALKDLEVKQ